MRLFQSMQSNPTHSFHDVKSCQWSECLFSPSIFHLCYRTSPPSHDSCMVTSSVSFTSSAVGRSIARYRRINAEWLSPASPEISICCQHMEEVDKNRRGNCYSPPPLNPSIFSASTSLTFSSLNHHHFPSSSFRFPVDLSTIPCFFTYAV